MPHKNIIALTALLVMTPLVAKSEDNLTHDSANRIEALNGTLGPADFIHAAADFRLGSEALMRFADSLQVSNSMLCETLVKVTEQLANGSKEFDPFGFKTGFKTIQLQNETIKEQCRKIQELQEREIERLRDEVEMLREQVKLRPSQL